MTDTKQAITVEEAASRLAVSIATVRRRCARGDFDAHKIGRSWVIDPDSLPATTKRRTRRHTSASGLIDFRQSLRHLRSQDLVRDVWVPDIIGYADDLADTDRLTGAAAARVDLAEPFDPPTVIPVPKSAIFQRNAMNLTLPDRLAYHGAVLATADMIDRQTSAGVFSARLSDNDDRFLRRGTNAWVRWKSAVEKSLVKRGGWMVATDITAFFDCIHHSVLLQDLESLGADPAIRSAIREMLRTWSVTPNTGIPQGPDASRVLANFYMHPIDDVMSALPNIEYFRYMDDIRLVSGSKHVAIEALRTLDVECRRRNLHLSTKKTHLLPVDKALESLTDERIEKAKYVYEIGVDSVETRVELKKLFRAAVGKEVDTRRAKFSIYRLQTLRERGVLRLVMKRLDDLAPLGWLIPAYILPWLRDSRTAAELGDFFHDSERNTSDFLSTWLLAAVLDEPHAATTSVVSYARGVAFDARASQYHRAVAMNVVALARNRRDIDRLRDIAMKEYDPEVVRGALVALKRAGSLDKSVAQRAGRINGIDMTLAYLKGRTSLPSLIFSTVRNSVA